MILSRGQSLPSFQSAWPVSQHLSPLPLPRRTMHNSPIGPGSGL